MAEKKNFLKNMKIIIRPSPRALKILLILVILFSMAALGTIRLVHNGIKEQIREMKEEAADLEHANSELDRIMEDPDSLENLQNAAKKELGLVDPDTIIIDPR